MVRAPMLGKTAGGGVARAVALVAVALALARGPRPLAPPSRSSASASSTPTIFADPWWRALQTHRVRYVAAWDALRYDWSRAEVDAYMAAAHAAGADVLLGFGHSRVPSRAPRLPTPRQFRREFLRFRARYPWVHEYLTWNEANHCSQPTCRRPDVAARYYNALRRACRDCTIVAADVLDTRRCRRGSRRSAIGARPHADLGAAQLHRRQPLPHARDAQPPARGAGRGLVHRDRRAGERNNGSPVEFPENKWHAARATRWVFQRLARLSPRVRRVYLYQWSPAGHDLGLGALGADGQPRPAYRVLYRPPAGRRAARRARAGR